MVIASLAPVTLAKTYCIHIYVLWSFDGQQTIVRSKIPHPNDQFLPS